MSTRRKSTSSCLRLTLSKEYGAPGEQEKDEGNKRHPERGTWRGARRELELVDLGLQVRKESNVDDEDDQSKNGC